MTLVNRGIGQELSGAPTPTPAPPWDRPGDEGECHMENIAALNGTFPEPTGDPETHIAVHLRFLRTPLGQAMPKRLRSKLVQHVLGHLAEALRVEDEGGIDATPMEQAAKLAALERGYANGVTG